MIEEEQLLSCAAETGFRLCYSGDCVAKDSGDSGCNKTFSATWDPNDSNKLFVCSQNGQLKIINIADGTSIEYHVLFRTFSPAFEDCGSDPGKAVQSHWDKLLIVPNRPGEIIFMLGVSNLLLYTAIPGIPHPYPTEPMIARTTRGDSSEYLYGTPVLELSSHNCRVTALAASSNGHLLASGDEHGNLRISVLVHRVSECVTSFAKTKRLATRNAASSELEALDKSVSNTVNFKPHCGPIFSVQWLPVTIPITIPITSVTSTSDPGSDESGLMYYFATGSADQKVRVWKAVYCRTKGLVITPYCNLDTTTTQVLSMHSYLIPTAAEHIKTENIRQQLYQAINSTCSGDAISTIKKFLRLNSDLNTASNDNGNISARKIGQNNAPYPTSTNSAGVSNVRQSLLLYQQNRQRTCIDLLSDSSVYVAAGTSLGFVYVWKFSISEIINGIPNVQSTYKNRRLHSLLQSSEYPIVQISLTSSFHSEDNMRRTIGADSRSQRLVVATSDTHACVRSHCATDQIAEFNNERKEPDITGSQYPRFQSYTPPGLSENVVMYPLQSNMSKAVNDGVECKSDSTSVGVGMGVGVGPVTLCGESHYSSPIVSCNFREVVNDVVNLELFTESAEEKKGDLATQDSSVTVEDLLKFLQIQEEINSTQSENVNIPDGHSKLFVCDLDGVMQMYPTHELLGIMSDLKGHKMKNGPHDPSDPILCKSIPLKDKNITKKNQPELRISSRQISENEETNNGDNDAESDDDDITSRPPPPQPTTHQNTKSDLPSNLDRGIAPLNQINHDQNSDKIKVKNMFREKERESGTERERPKESEHEWESKVGRGRERERIEERREVGDMCDESEIKNVESPPKNLLQSLKKQQIKQQQQSKIQSKLNERRIELEKELENELKEQQIQRDRGLRHNNVNSSSHSYPAIHSSQMIFSEIDDLREEIDNDDFTVSTVDTTSTDYRIAGKIATSSNGQLRYKNLTRINCDEDIKKNSDFRKRGGAKVDPVWIRKTLAGPTPKQMALLSTPNPMVKLNFCLHGSSDTGLKGNHDLHGIKGPVHPGGNGVAGTSLGSGGKYRGGIGGLESSVDPVTLMPTFSMDIK